MSEEVRVEELSPACVVRGVLFAMLREDGTVLMEKCPKKAERHGGEWFLPGGRILARETPLQAMHREMGEELDCGAVEYYALPLVDCGPTSEYWMSQPFIVTRWQCLRSEGLPSHILDHPEVSVRWVDVEEERARTPIRAVYEVLNAAMRRAYPLRRL